MSTRQHLWLELIVLVRVDVYWGAVRISLSVGIEVATTIVCWRGWTRAIWDLVVHHATLVFEYNSLRFLS